MEEWENYETNYAGFDILDIMFEKNLAYLMSHVTRYYVSINFK